VRATRVIYVENDPALRGILTTMLNSSPDIEVILSTSNPSEALAFEDLSRPDVALLDLALGQGEMNGVDLGIALRQQNTDLGIVIYSQYPLDFATERVPAAELVGWSTLQKSGQLNLEELVKLLKTTALGVGQRTHSGEKASENSTLPRSSEVARLSTRQRAIMGLTASGFSPQQISEQLSLSYDVVRQDLVRAYRILVPDEAEGDDRRTQAALAYVRLTRDVMWEAL